MSDDPLLRRGLNALGDPIDVPKEISAIEAHTRDAANDLADQGKTLEEIKGLIDKISERMNRFESRYSIELLTAGALLAAIAIGVWR